MNYLKNLILFYGGGLLKIQMQSAGECFEVDFDNTYWQYITNDRRICDILI